MDPNTIETIEYDCFVHTHIQIYGGFPIYSDNSGAVVPNSDPQNDSVLLYDEVSGGLRSLEEGEVNFHKRHILF